MELEVLAIQDDRSRVRRLDSRREANQRRPTRQAQPPGRDQLALPFVSNQAEVHQRRTTDRRSAERTSNLQLPSSDEEQARAASCSRTPNAYATQSSAALSCRASKSRMSRRSQFSCSAGAVVLRRRSATGLFVGGDNTEVGRAGWSWSRRDERPDQPVFSTLAYPAER